MMRYAPGSARHVATWTLGVALALMLCTAAGCAPGRPTVSADPDERNRELSEGYALLYDLLEENRQIDQAVRIPFRSVSDETRALLGDIASASGDAADRLYEFADAAAELGLDEDGLPTLETATRDSIASATQRALLAGDRNRFELYLLLSQTEATRYAAHLARQLAEAEPQSARRAYLEDTYEQFDQLYERVLDRLAVQE
ncbi:hypothetical protein ACERK3_04035 [Phycisphaerales bacterium AB-hyl4]|uniref:DUF4142 domain-containing protein n=1 Tax=Natronomicrosphaera hydrolytica TaxID=3242702 RepID=A0ABV4U4P4_9BACT